MPKALGQTQLRTPGDIPHGFGLPLLTHLEHTADTGAVAIAPGCLDGIRRACLLPLLVMLP
jgi:hypothetical protein